MEQLNEIGCHSTGTLATDKTVNYVKYWYLIYWDAKFGKFTYKNEGVTGGTRW